MKIMEHIMKALSSRVVFCTFDAITENVSGCGSQMYADDWRICEDVLGAIRRYNPRSVYLIANYDEIPMGYISSEEAKDVMVDVCSIIKRETDAFVDYIFCETLSENPMRMPQTGMMDYFINRDELDVDDIVMIGNSQNAKECSLLRGCKYYDKSKIKQLC